MEVHTIHLLHPVVAAVDRVRLEQQIPPEVAQLVKGMLAALERRVLVAELAVAAVALVVLAQILTEQTREQPGMAAPELHRLLQAPL